MTVDLKKVLSLNLPYLLFVYLFDKLCQAVRLAPGLDASEKFLHLSQGFTEAFSSGLPSLHPLDLLAGIAGAVIVRLAVYAKSKNTKKYRKGIEYGSARWGTAADIAPYVDPVPDWNIPLTQTEKLTMSSRPKNPKYARNKNILVIGGSGSGKTRFFVKPSLMQMHSSYVVTDPKGQLLSEVGTMLRRGAPKLDENGKPLRDARGKVIYEPYRIKVLNTINFKKSMKYNPFAYIRSEKDILKLVNVIIANTKGDGEKSSEDFWVKAERLLYCALIGYIWYEAEPEEKNFLTLLELINASEAREDDEEFQSPVDLLFSKLEKEHPDHFAVKQYRKFKLAAGKTLKSILISCGARLAPFDIAELREIMSDDELELDTLGDRKTALFLIMSDTDTTFNFVILTDFMEADGNIMVTMHIRGINQNEAIKMVKRKITDLDAMKIQEQKRAVRSGYDMDILPSDLSTYGGAAKDLLTDLQSRNERMFNMTFLVLHTAETRQKLEIAVSQAASVAQTYNCLLTRLDFQQEDGLMSSLPLGLNRIKIERSLTTSALAVFVPFVTQEVFMGGDAMYYGLNALSNNMILLDRKQSRCPNGLVFGTPGSGKSMSCKREITFIMLMTQDNVIICDPEDEYSPLVKRLGGQVVRLSPSSTDYVNPLDINLNYSEEENPLALKSDFVLSFCELIMGSKTGLEAIEKTVIDRAVQMIYQPYFADPRPENMPILGDLMNALLSQHIPEADRVAQALDLYVNGSLNFFNHRTTVDISNRLVCFDIKGLGKNLKKPGMLIVQDAVWNTVTINRAIGRSTWYFVDEFHLLLKEEQTAAYSAEIWKRFRKWGGIPTGATQNPKDLLSSPEIENILENSDFIYMLNQAAGDRKILAERLNISSEQLAYVTNSEPGHGLLFFNNVILPFADDFPKDTELYKLLTTKPSEVEHEERMG